MAKSLCTIMTRDYSRKRASDAVNITSLTTQLFYAVLLDFMTAYQLVGFNAKLTPETVEELEGCDNIEENMLKYITNYSGDNVNNKKDLRDPGKNMLGELQKPKFDPNNPDKKKDTNEGNTSKTMRRWYYNQMDAKHRHLLPLFSGSPHVSDGKEAI